VLVPLVGDVRLGRTVRLRWREAILIGKDATAAERRRFYNALREIKWLPPRAHSAILQALGSSSLRKQKFDDETRRMMRLQHRIDQGATRKQIAAGEGIKVSALNKQLQRFRDQQRLGKGDIARIASQKKIALLKKRKQERGKK